MPDTIPWYDEATHTLVCPVRGDDEDREKLLLDLHRIGCVSDGEIPVPLDLGVRFFRVRLPPWLTRAAREPGDGRRDFRFTDARGRERLSVLAGADDWATNAWRRYVPLDWNAYYGDGAYYVPTVRDRQRDGAAGVVWTDPAGERAMDRISMAVAWLDANKPDWRNPAAYWGDE